MFDVIQELNQATSMLSVKQVAKIFQVSDKTIRRMIARREIPSILFSGQRRFDPKVLAWWYEKLCPLSRKARYNPTGK